MKFFLYLIFIFQVVPISLAEDQMPNTFSLFPYSKGPLDKVRLGLELEGKLIRGGTLGEKKNNLKKMIIKQWGEMKFEPYFAVGGREFELKIKTGINLTGHMLINDVTPFEAGTKNEGNIGIYGGLALEGKDNRFKIEGKAIQIVEFVNIKIHQVFLGLTGVCTSPSKKGLKLQFCGNAFVARKLYEGDKGLEVGAEVLLQQQDEDGGRIFLGGRLAREQFDSKSPDIYFAAMILGGNFDLNPGAIRSSRQR